MIPEACAVGFRTELHPPSHQPAVSANPAEEVRAQVASDVIPPRVPAAKTKEARTLRDLGFQPPVFRSAA